MTEPAADRVVLASQSAVRARLLAAAGVSARIAPAHCDEAALIASLSGRGQTPTPAEIALALASAKARAVTAASSEIVIGADQLLMVDGAVLQKVADLSSAAERLWRMRGCRHTLVTACALSKDGEITWRRCDEVVVTLRAFSRAALDAYLETVGEDALRSVSCYEIEGFGAQLISQIEGDYFAALGLPLLPLLEALREAGHLPM